jgi:hypothetical protein
MITKVKVFYESEDSQLERFLESLHPNDIKFIFKKGYDYWVVYAEHSNEE